MEKNIENTLEDFTEEVVVTPIKSTRHHKKESWLSTRVAIIIGSIIIGLFILIGFGMQSSRVQGGSGYVDPDSIFAGRTLVDDEFLSGDSKDRVILLEYSDLECPFCKQLHNASLDNLIDEYDGRVAFAYRHFPLSFHDKAYKEAEATLCVRDQGGQSLYRQYIENIFTITPANNQLDVALLPIEAEKLGVDMGVFNECLTSGKYAEYVQDDLRDGIMMGVSGTPMMFILVKQKDGSYQILTAISGAREQVYIEKVLDQALKMDETNNRSFFQKLFN